jgi:hypothetical protein
VQVERELHDGLTYVQFIQKLTNQNGIHMLFHDDGRLWMCWRGGEEGREIKIL